MSVTNKIDNFLYEASIPSQQTFHKMLSKGLDDPGIIFQMSMALWHYVNPKIIGGGGRIYSQGSKKLIDELWNRVGSNIESSEQFEDRFVKKLKSNFYGLSKVFDKIYSWNKEGYWETK